MELQLSFFFLGFLGGVLGAFSVWGFVLGFFGINLTQNSHKHLLWCERRLDSIHARPWNLPPFTQCQPGGDTRIAHIKQMPLSCEADREVQYDLELYLTF